MKKFEMECKKIELKIDWRIEIPKYKPYSRRHADHHYITGWLYMLRDIQTSNNLTISNICDTHYVYFLI